MPRRQPPVFLDSLVRLGDELNRKIWAPSILLLRPTPPADYEPALISNFLNYAPLSNVMLAPAVPDLRAECELHEVRLDEALQNLQLKVAAGIDIGSVARLLMTVGSWITVRFSQNQWGRSAG